MNDLIKKFSEMIADELEFTNGWKIADADYKNHCNNVAEKIYLKVESKIKELSERDNWISVEDELPKTEGHYLFYEEYWDEGHNYIRYQSVSWYDPNRNPACKECGRSDTLGELGDDVTHWKPLPKPPQGEKK